MVLDDICLLIADCPHSTAPDEGVGYPLIRTPNIGRARFSLDGVHRVSAQVYEQRNKRATPQDDDIILAREAPAGNAAIIKHGEKYCMGQRTVLIRPNPQKVNPDFLVYYLLAPEQQHKLLSTAHGATVSHVNIPDIHMMNVDNLPDYKSQRRIADILCAHDDLIENNQKQIRLLEEAAQRLYKEWFIDLRFPGYETTPVHDGVPEGWEKRSLGEIANIVMGQSPKSEYYNTENQGLPFHQGVGSYRNRFVIDDVYSTSYTRIADAGSILFSVRAPVGRLNITRNKIVIGRGIAALNQKEGLQSLLFYMLKERFFKDNLVGNGSIFASISKDELLGQSFIVPVSSIAHQFNEITSTIDKKIEAVDEEILKLTEARDRLLPKLMSGEIEV